MYSKRTGSVLSRWLGAFPQVLEEASDLPVPTGWVLRRAQPPRRSTDTETNETRTTKTTLFLRVPGVSLLLSLCVSSWAPLGLFSLWFPGGC